MLIALFRFVVALFAILLMAIGIILTPTPLPVGVIFLAIGFALIVAVAPDAVRWVRRHWRWFDRQVHKLEELLPEWIAKHLRAAHDPKEESDDNCGDQQNVTQD